MTRKHSLLQLRVDSVTCRASQTGIWRASWGLEYSWGGHKVLLGFAMKVEAAMRRAGVLMVVFGLSIAAVRAQNAAESQQECTLAGTVVDAIPGTRSLTPTMESPIFRRVW